MARRVAFQYGLSPQERPTGPDWSDPRGPWLDVPSDRGALEVWLLRWAPVLRDYFARVGDPDRAPRSVVLTDNRLGPRTKGERVWWYPSATLDWMPTPENPDQFGIFGDGLYPYKNPDAAEKARQILVAAFDAVADVDLRVAAAAAAQAEAEAEAAARRAPLARRQRERVDLARRALGAAGAGPVALRTPDAVLERSGRLGRSRVVSREQLEAAAAAVEAAADAGASPDEQLAAGLATYGAAGGDVDVDDMAALFDLALGSGALEQTPFPILVLLLLALPDEVLDNG